MSGLALAIGNFDGVHLGHRALLNETISYADAHGLQPAVLTFDPHPTVIVAPDRVPPLLTSIDERIRLLHEFGVERVEVLRFTKEIAALSPHDFVKNIVVDQLHARAVFVGENFRFGAGKQGSPEMLRNVAGEFGFVPHFLRPVSCRGQIVSSTVIRHYLEAEQVSRANRLLGRCFALQGVVVTGHGIGRRQTVPTLNMQPLPGLLVPRGVYITKATDLDDGRQWHSITNAGTRPTFNGHELSIETFLLSPFSPPDPPRIQVEFRRFVRPEREFPDPAALRSQILRDVSRAQAYWRRVDRFAKSVASVY